MKTVSRILLLAGGLSAAFLPMSACAEVERDSLFPFVISLNGPAPAVDLSALVPAPAGKDGFVRSEGERFVTAAGPIRFNAVNLTGAACFPPPDKADRLAERLRRLGVNCVRLHYFDVACYGNFIQKTQPGLFKDDPTSSRIVDEAQRERLDYLVAALGKRGIYLNVNLHVGLELDERDGFPKGNWAHRGETLFCERLIQANRAYARELLTHVNPHTGKSYADDPAVAMVEINNENGMWAAWCNGFFDSAEASAKGRLGFFRQFDYPAEYADRLNERWNVWLAKRYGGDLAAVEKAWGCRPKPFGENRYLMRKAPGPDYPQAVTNDFCRFLDDVDADYYRGMREFLRNDLGVKCVIYGTQLDYTSSYTLAETGDAVDLHNYWTHPSYKAPHPGINMRRGPHPDVNWSNRNESMLASDRFDRGYDGNFVPHRAGLRVKGCPFITTECAAPYPNWYGAEFQPFLHALGAFQGWAGIFAYTWGNESDVEPTHCAYFFSSAARTDCVAHFPACAAMFLRGDVRPARTRVHANESRAALAGRLAKLNYVLEGLHSSVSRASDGAVEPNEVLIRGVVVDLSGQSAAPAALDTATKAEMAKGVYRSDTGEITLDRSDRQHVFFTVNTANVKLFSGSSVFRAFDLGDGVTVEPGNNILGWCTVSLTSLQGNGFRKGARLLLAATGYAQNGGAKYRPIGGSRWGATGAELGSGKTVVEGIRVKVVLPFAGVRCRVIDEQGVAGREVSVVSSEDSSCLVIGPEYRTVWYELTL